MSLFEKHKKRFYPCVSSNKERRCARKTYAVGSQQQVLLARTAEFVEQMNADDEHHDQRRQHGRVQNLAEHAVVHAVLPRRQVSGVRHVVGAFHASHVAARLRRVNVYGRNKQHWQEYCQQQSGCYFSFLCHVHGCKGTNKRENPTFYSHSFCPIYGLLTLRS